MTTPLRDDFDASGLRLLARNSKDAGQARRLLALAAIYEGAKRHEAAKIGGVTLQIVRDWVLRFNAEGPAGLYDRPRSGRRARRDAARRVTLRRLVLDGPDVEATGLSAWTLPDLCREV